ncbi:MAG: hypothetical protein ACFB20_11815 [Opitutales bacterium]
MERPLARVILIAGLALHLAGFVLLSQAFETPVLPPERPSSFLSALPQAPRDASTLLTDQALLLDDEPLFLPTRWNAATPGSPRFGAPEDIPNPFGALEQVPLGALPQVFPAPGPRPAPPDETVEGALVFWSYFERFGQGERTQQIVPERAGFVRVERSGTAEAVIAEAVAAFPGEDWPDVLWSPVQLHLLVSDRAVPTVPLLVESSGNALVDARLVEWVSGFAQRYGLAPGYYTVTVGP